MTTTSTTLSSLTPNPTTPAVDDDLEWITAYLIIHRLSYPSWRYAYILWFLIALVAICFGACHMLGLRGGLIGAYWSKWALRRRTWRKKHTLARATKRGVPHKQPIPLPSNAQLLCLSVVVCASIALTFVGPDYVKPTYKLWEFKRDDTDIYFSYQPQYTISKAWWTAGGRAGITAFALFPLVVLFALKAAPFAIFSLPLITDIHFDKLAWLHRWIGRLVWFLSALHVLLWSAQLIRDKRTGTDQIAYVFAWQYPKFLFAWTAFACMTLLVVLSLRPIREKYYEAFYSLHLILVPLSIIFSALHHPPLWWWCWAALGLWMGERIWRFTRWLYTNGFVGGKASSLPITPAQNRPNQTQKESWEMHKIETDGHLGRPPINPFEPDSHTSSPYHSHVGSLSSLHFPLNSSLSPSNYIPPPGYAHVELLTGRTIRVRLVTPGYLTWAPGQHFLISMPSVSKLHSHPFTVASICDEQVTTDDGRMIMFLIRAKAGWTKDLWDTVVRLTAMNLKHPRHESSRGMPLPPIGVILRTWVDGPFGSSARTNWSNFSSVLIVSGGSGVSFGLSVLEYLCLCMVGRDGKYLGGNTGWGKMPMRLEKIRFIWMLREFSHVQWCASVLRRCMALVPPEHLQVEVFVTNFKLPDPRHLATPSPLATPISPGDTLESAELAPPVPQFTRERRRERRGSMDSMASDVESDTVPDGIEAYVDLSYYTDYIEGQDSVSGGRLDHEEHVLDYTNFDGDNDERMPGESSMNRTVRKEGRKRRAMSRRMSQLVPNASDAVALRNMSTSNGPSTSSSPYTHHAKRSNDLDAYPRSPSRLSPRDSSPMMAPSSAHLFSAAKQSAISFQAPTPSSRTHFQAPSEVSLLSPSTAGNLGTTPLGRPKLSVQPDWDARSEVGSVHALMGPHVGEGANGQQVKLQVEEGELQDISIMAEFVRPGRPKLDLVLKDEAKKAKGAMAVAVCGPTGLNAVMRKAVAAQIDPNRIRKGDMGGSITFVSEEFGY